MKRSLNFLTIAAATLALFAGTSFAQIKTETKAQVKTKAAVKTQVKAQNASLNLNNGTGPNWVDADGDGICDNFGTDKQGVNRQGRGYGKMDGTGTPLRPQDGTGFGAKRGGGIGTGTGVCDGTGSGAGTGSATGTTGTRGRRGGRR